LTGVTLKPIIEGRMKYRKTCRLLAASIAIALLLVLVAGAVPAAAASVRVKTLGIMCSVGIGLPGQQCHRLI
jgi:hypothetical protein